MLAAGLNVGLGHDAAESSNSCDLFDVMKFASLIHRAYRVDASLLQAPAVVRMATRNGAAALRHNTGELAPGRKADVILVDTRSAMFTPLLPGDPAHVYSHLVFAARRQRGGHHDRGRKILMRGRELTTVDEATVLDQANQALQRVITASIGTDQEH